MANSRISPRPPALRPAPRGRRPFILAAAGTLVLLAVAIVVFVMTRSGGSGTAALPLPQTTGRAAGVVVDAPAVNLGNVPLNQNVSQVFHLRNTATGAVALEQPRIEVLEGC